ncbi:BtrN protein [hydrothermal vent metagenome]|uniref:BtrN protein n=1 Tax=hydrothermal vent metagenome TaxID=652676 RepID=A0A1W1D4S3_9ZZZZ
MNKRESRFIDKSTHRKKEIVKEKLKITKGIPLFSIVEFNIIGSCNRNCSFCPVSNPKIYTKTKDAISLELFEKIVKDLQEIHYEGKILFSAFSEPLLHKQIEDLIVIAKKYLPNSRLEIVSNGDLLTVKKLQKLYASGLDTINISMYDGPHQIEYFEQMRKEANVPKDGIVLRRRYFENGNYGITISNRVGLIDSNKYRDKKEKAIVKFPLKHPCYYPFYMILVDYNGDVLLCPHDWNKTLKFGNLQKEKLFDIWNGKALNGIRKRLADSDRNFGACKNCDVLGTLIGKESFDQWMKVGL